MSLFAAGFCASSGVHNLIHSQYKWAGVNLCLAFLNLYLGLL